jgi:hypothetical protein
LVTKEAIMHVAARAAALDHRGLLTEYHTCDELVQKATEKLPPAVVPEALYMLPNGQMLLTLAGEDRFDEGLRDVVLVDPATWTHRFARYGRNLWPDVVIWARKPHPT